MKTLILNGSPRKNGDIAALLDAFIGELKGEVRVLSMYDGVSPCLDCRYCWTRPGCAVQDGMQEIYDFLPDCDNVVLASPVWFSSLSGPLLNLASRFQTYFAGRMFRKEPAPLTPKNGVVLFAGGEPGTEEPALKAAMTIFKMVNVRRPAVAVVRSMRTDALPAREDAAALEAARAAARALNALHL